MTYFTIFKSIKSVGISVYVTTILPYVLLFVFFVKGISLEGCSKGWVYLFTPDWSKILTFQIWKEAAAQVIFSCNIGSGYMIFFASNRPKNENILKAAVGVPAMNFLTSVFASVVLFSFLGYASAKTGIEISEMPIEGPELAFVVYPALIASLPLKHFWAITFFIMLVTLGLSSTFPDYL